ncbi:MAG TPA: universal stress protein [Polyangiaceae bacterium]|nr:universal stress protein [Polyangiaceae bacterium]
MTEKSILFATDFESAAAQAQDELVRVAKAFHASVYVMTALPSALRTWVSSGLLERQALERVEAWVQELEAAGVRASALPVVRGNAAEAIAETAERTHIDLIFVGASNKGTLERLMIGSTAEAVARCAFQPVWMSRPRQDTIERVVVGVDGSDASRVAIEDGYAIADRTGAMVSLVAAIENPDLNPLGMTVAEEEAENSKFRAAHEDEIRKFVQRVAPAHPDDVHFFWGAPSEVLATFARDQQADVLVIGRWGEGGIRRVLFGGTAERTLRVCPCSLVITGAPRSG